MRREGWLFRPQPLAPPSKPRWATQLREWLPQRLRPDPEDFWVIDKGAQLEELLEGGGCLLTALFKVPLRDKGSNPLCKPLAGLDSGTLTLAVLARPEAPRLGACAPDPKGTRD